MCLTFHTAARLVAAVRLALPTTFKAAALQRLIALAPRHGLLAVITVAVVVGVFMVEVIPVVPVGLPALLASMFVASSISIFLGLSSFATHVNPLLALLLMNNEHVNNNCAVF